MSAHYKELYYFPDYLKKQLSKIPHYPLTVVEGPSGFGKTTAVREYIKEHLPHDAHEYWYTCLGNPTAKTWNGICSLFEYVDCDIADKLRALEFTSADTLTDIANLIQKICCDFETFLIIDNYQILNSIVPEEFLSAFSIQTENSNIHIIFITQQLSVHQQTVLRHSAAHIIPASDFFFDRNSTARLFKLAGIRLTDKELENVHTSTEGWVSALRLQMINYQKYGCFEYNAGIEQLVEAAIWKKLSMGEKDFLLAVSVLDSFTLGQAKRMLGKNCLTESIENLLASNALINYYFENSTYIMHSILQGYLRRRFYQYQSEDCQKQMLSLAGQACVDISDYSAAARFFLEAGDFEAFLSFPLQTNYLSCTSDWTLIDLIVRTVRVCPDDLLRRHPEAVLILSFQLFLFCQYELSGYLCEIARMALENPVDLDECQIKRLNGEMEYLLSFNEYNDIKKMSARHKAAYAQLEGPSSYRFALGNFGSVSIMYMYWSKSGELEQTIGLMEENLPLYRLLSGGHSTGSDSAMRAEWLLQRGDTEAAEILCYKAIYAAQSDNQACICLCAELVLARIALLRGDAEGYCRATEHIGQCADLKLGMYNERAAQLCLASLTLTIGEVRNIPDWLNSPDVIDKNLYPATVPYGQMLYGKLLLIEKRYSELYAVSQMAMELALKSNYLLTQVYHLLYLAVAKLNDRNTKKAQMFLNQALEIALPDQVYLPFAEHATLIPLLEFARHLGFDKDKINCVLSLCTQQQEGVQAVTKALRNADSPLTVREREIALLAKGRFSAKEIAGKLYISESTVKSTLKSIYRKLDVQSKTQLIDKKI